MFCKIKKLKQDKDDKIIIEFGLKSCISSFVLKDSTLYVEQQVINELCIIDSISYQLIEKEKKIVVGPIVGLIISNLNMSHSISFYNRYLDRLKNYKSHHGLIVFYSCDNIDFNNEVVYGKYYDINTNSLKFATLPIPKVNFRRFFRGNQNTINKLNDIGAKVLNQSKISKYIFYKRLVNNENLKIYLPDTYKLSNFDLFIEKLIFYKELILKPNNLSRGRGIYIVKYLDGMYLLKCTSTSLVIKCNYDDFKEKINYLDNYIYQELIDLYKYKGSNTDIRVITQLTKEGNFTVTGSEVRVASDGNDITNLSRGASVISIEELNIKDYLLEEIKDVCINLSKELSNKINIIELGIDIALDNKLNIYIIEANFFPSYKGIKKLDIIDYNTIRQMPIYYMIYIQNFRVFLI